MIRETCRKDQAVKKLRHWKIPKKVKKGQSIDDGNMEKLVGQFLSTHTFFIFYSSLCKVKIKLNNTYLCTADHRKY